jgi:hypothetical protein
VGNLSGHVLEEVGSLAMAHVCSLGKSPTNPRTFSDTSIVAPAVGGYSSAYLYLELPAGNASVYGVTIKYTT